MNLLTNIAPGKMGALKWLREPARWEPLTGGGIRVVTPPKTDYFQDPRGLYTNDNAPYLCRSVRGDFFARARVRPTFATTWDAGCLLVRQDAQCWAKICYERTDFDTHAVVSVVTRGVSDDANGADLTADEIWLQAARVGEIFAQHYSLDGQNWRLVRYFVLPAAPEVLVGVAAQSPAGPGATVDFLDFMVEERAVADLRAGV